MFDDDPRADLDPLTVVGQLHSGSMGKPAESVVLDEDVQEELRKLAERSGRPVGALANAALRGYVRYEGHVAASIERGVADLDAGRARTTEEVLAYLEAQRRSRG
jgi:predicted transcriptional regulator